MNLLSNGYVNFPGVDLVSGAASSPNNVSSDSRGFYVGQPYLNTQSSYTTGYYGVYFAKYTGAYFVSWGAIGLASISLSSYAAIRVNHIFKYFTHWNLTNSTSTTWANPEMQVIVNCVAGDFINIWVGEPSTFETTNRAGIYNNDHNFFSIIFLG